MSAGRDDKARSSDRKKRVRKAIQNWKEHRAEVKAKKRNRRDMYRASNKLKDKA